VRHWGNLSVTARLTLLFAAVSSTVLLILGLLIAALVERHFVEMDVELLAGKVELVRHALAAAGPDRTALAGQLDAALVGHHGLAVAVWDGAGQALYETPGAAFPPDLPTEAPARWRGPDGRQFRGLAAAVAGGTVAVSTDLGHHEHFMHSFRLALWTVVGLAALLTGLLGWVAARRGLAPLRAICRDAAAITADRLDRRLATEAIPEELAAVAHTLNAMLARLEDSFRRLSDFSSDLAHELRTPVSNLLTQTQVTLGRARSVADYQDVLASNVEELERLSRTIADMLFLAKADHQQLIPHRETVDLAAAVASLFEFYEALAEEKGLRLAATGQATVSGDRLMLRRALGNLLSNAVRHTPAGGAITVSLAAAGAEGIRVVVDNTGPDIPPEHLPRLFDRFYRADASRRHGGEGAGLGLAITRSIVVAHGGSVAVASAQGHTRFTLTLPA